MWFCRGLGTFSVIYGTGVKPGSLLLRPFIILLCQPWMTVMIVEQLVE
jgi:hypothetical protein